ncbi:MAG TPA: PstS family phosphate ABC transporter substrate-binding protein [Rhodospirillales bacterium]|nr:PstS family phosphate ABC transporter substrate-binding protein [Rhodospirillales bacterium]
MKSTTIALAIVAATTMGGVTLPGQAEAREQIRIVGSSTVYPFATTVAERFGKSTKFKTPVVESTGSGGGLKLFCAGVGDQHPDITNASRRIKKSEVKKCAANGVTDVTEVKIGYDGIVIANSKEAVRFELSLKDLYLALAKNVPAGEGKTQANPYKTWKDVNAALPATKIEVLGPPPTSGTRDAFVELAMEGGCKKVGWIKAMKKTDKKAYKTLCHTIREDGAFIEAGENDNLIVQKLQANSNALGIFGFSYLDQNADKVQGSKINGIAPKFEAIADGSYPISRALYFYVKQAQVGKVPGMKAYIREFTSEKAWGDEGYLADKGLIPMPVKERALFRKGAEELANLNF